MTIFAFLCFLALLTLCGVVPAFLLLPRDPSGHRILLIPFLGLCSGILLTYGLAALGMSGQTIAVVTLILLGVATILSVITLRRRRLAGRSVPAPFHSEELKRAGAPVLAGLVVVVVAAWPLFYQGHEHFWGFSNPDQPYYFSILKHLQTHSFGQPEGDFAGQYGSSILGVSYFFSMLALLTSIPVELLFGVVSAGILFLVPISTCLLAEKGFGLPRRTTLAAGFAITTSALVAQTFYLQSLGALTVVALVPIGLTLAIHYTQRPSLTNAFVLALVTAGMYFCYFPGVGVMGVLIASIFGVAILRRAISIRKALIPAGFAAGLVFLMFLPQANHILQTLIAETFSNRLTVSASSDEVLLSFALVITEEVVPFFWGFSYPGAPSGLLFGESTTTFVVLFTLGCLLFVILLLSAVRRLSGLSSYYVFALSAVLGVTSIYIVTSNAYGVFKLIAWIQPLVIIGVTATCLGAASAMRHGRLRLLAVLPMLLLVAYSGLNLIRTVRFGRISTGTVTGSMHNLPSYDLDSFRRLAEVGTLTGDRSVLIGLPDPVVQRWTVPFLEAAHLMFAPLLTLDVQDSGSESGQQNLTRTMMNLESAYLLHWDDSAADIVPTPSVPPIWRSGAFALTPVWTIQNTLLLGAGWYRKEQYPDSEFLWLRRFRWLRKRAEAILLNPVAEPVRLRLTLLAGAGNDSPTRHVALWVNGQKLEEVEFTGHARVTSPPFVPARPWTHLELEVREDAHLLPREGGLWALWVPRDFRRLNIAVSEFALVSDKEIGADLVTTLDLTSPDGFTRTTFDGIYPDRWMAAQAKVELRLPPDSTAIEISGMVPGIPVFTFPYRIRLTANGVSLEEQFVESPGPFRLRFPLRTDGRTGRMEGTAQIIIQPEATFVGTRIGTSQDPRALSILLDRISVIASESQENSTSH